MSTRVSQRIDTRPTTYGTVVHYASMARKITPKQKKFADAYLKLDNGTGAALAVYDVTTNESARAIASQNLAKPVIQNYLMEALPDDLLARVHSEGLNATRIEDDGPDYAVRHKYLETAYKLKGSYAAEKSVYVNLTGEDLKAQLDADLARFRAK